MVPEFLHFHQFPSDASVAGPPDHTWKKEQWPGTHTVTNICSYLRCVIYTYELGHSYRYKERHSFRPQILSTFFFLEQALYIYRHTYEEQPDNILED